MEYVLGAAQYAAAKLFDTFQDGAFKEMCNVWGYKSQLQDLQCTVDTIQAALLHTDSKQELPHQAQIWLEQVKDAIYDAEDLLDKFATYAKLKELEDKDKESGNFPKKVRRFLSSENPALVAFNMSREVKDVRNRLDSIAENHKKYGFEFDSQPIRRRREETCSYVYAPDIIGREKDVDEIVGRLLDLNVRQGVSSLAIVGIGGLGKTTVAQLINDNPRIKENFPLRLWTCVGDQDTTQLDVKSTLRKILHAATSQNHEHLSMDHLQRQVQELLAGKKFLLFLDDIWNEVRNQWLELAKFLMGGLHGSWVVVTTRSEKTAMAVGDESPYMLQGLSEEDSWRLFVRTAFRERAEQADFDLVKIGQEIVQKCANVPLAIKVVGTLLYGQEKNKWLSLKEVAFGRMKQGDKAIESVLKFSYLNLEPPLKRCFGYCALFPKNYEIEKEKLINLWIAQGFVVPLDEGQSVEDAGEEYFSILLKRCFFQDVGVSIDEEHVTCKIHDLMHDIAEEVAGKEILKGNTIPGDLIDKVRHLNFNGALDEGTEGCLLACNKIRTFVRAYNCSWQEFDAHMALDSIFAHWKSLRALDFWWFSGMPNLPSTLNELIHLRYLDLSYNEELEVLPSSIAKLPNLQVLNLEQCRSLKELPIDLGKLTNLRILDIWGCDGLTYMPRGVGKLINLRKLPTFIVGEGTSDEEWGPLADQPIELKDLQNIKGNLNISINIPTNAEYDAIDNGRKGGCLSQHLTKIAFTFLKRDPEGWDFDPERIEDGNEIDEALLEDLQPHPNLKELKLEWYLGQRMPKWAREEKMAMLLPNLVSITLAYCLKLQHLAVLGQLSKLKSLELWSLLDLEYIENTTMSRSQSLESQESFFPSLEKLTLHCLEKLKGWWRDDNNSDEEGGLSLPSFPRLSKLDIWHCPNLASMPLCPSVEDLTMFNCNVNLRIMEGIESGNSKLRSILTNHVQHLKLAMPMEAFQCLTIDYDNKVENLSEVEEVFRTCSSSLRKLCIGNCSNLNSVNEGLKHLTALESLQLYFVPNLSLGKAGGGEEDNDDGMPWCCLRHFLRSLELHHLDKLVKLPDGMRHLTALQSLTIYSCRQLKSIPEWMPELTSLKQLSIIGCSNTLMERCKNDTGEDWPNIQHIPQLKVFCYRLTPPMTRKICQPQLPSIVTI